MKIIGSKPIEEFRNRYVGHLLNDKTKRPLSLEEIIDVTSRIYGENEATFINWVNKKGRTYPETVVSILEKTRSEIMREYNISKEEFDQWKDLDKTDT